MQRRQFLTLAAAMPAWTQSLTESKAIPEPHFPSPMYCFVWRNWELANTDRIARVLGTSERNVLSLGRAMGLPRKPVLSEDQLRRIYITVIRQNWHLLPETQLMELLGWDRKKYEFSLKEDDFLDVKLGRNKPVCAELRWTAPTAEQRRQAAAIRKTLGTAFGKELHVAGQPLFHFVGDLSSEKYGNTKGGVRQAAAGEVDLSQGWTISPAAGKAGERLSTYLQQAFGIDVPVKESDRALRFEEGDMRIAAEDRGITLRGAGPGERAHMVYLLQDQMERREGPYVTVGTRDYTRQWSPRYLYSYFALYGDPLLDAAADPFPGGYLEKLARCGINGVWLQGVLNTLAPSKLFPEFGEGSETRLRTLSALCARAAEYGVKVYLYMNEPRSMPAAFFRGREGMKGSEHQGLYSMCTSAPEVREWLTESLAHVFTRVPQLGGIFTISISENHTNCFSHGGAWRKAVPNAGNCPRCTQRTSWDTLGEMFSAMREGVRRGSKTADIIHWDWGWPDDMADRLIPLLDKDVKFSSISEWSQPVEFGGVKTAVGEYSISVPGPGPRASRNWALAKQAGIGTVARASFNNTWEISAVPYIPVPQLILEHCEKLRKVGVDGIMASWTCGGYPSPNLQAAKAFYFEAAPDKDQVLRDVAVQRFGPKAAGDAVEGWRIFSEAFREFPYGVSIYVIPVQHGPANLLRLEPTGHRPGMMLFPHDAMKSWCGKYPPEVVETQFQLLARKWREGLTRFERVAANASMGKKENAGQDLAIALTCYHHFQSVANQVEFYRLRENTARNRARLVELAKAEMDLAKRQYPVARGLSLIAYEATNHYYYTPLDLAEKILNCTRLVEELERG